MAALDHLQLARGLNPSRPVSEFDPALKVPETSEDRGLGSEPLAPPSPPSHMEQVPSHERPRERLFLQGAEKLSDVDLLALIMGGAFPAARELLASFGGLDGLARTMPHDLLEVAGVGMARAGALAAAVELSRRLGLAPLVHGSVIDNPKVLADYVRARVRGASTEQFMVIGLDARHRVGLLRTIAVGSVARVDVHPREIFRPLIRAGMSACVLAHNHPSGTAEPSAADLDLTGRMLGVGDLVGIPVLDHVIVSDFESVSMAESGLLARLGEGARDALAGESY